VADLKARTGLPVYRLLAFLDVAPAKFSGWKKVYGCERTSRETPCAHWLRPEEKEAIIDFKRKHMTVGYRRLAWMMVDEDVACVSPASVLRTLTEANLNNCWTRPAGKAKPRGFVQPESVHEQWHTDIAYVNMQGTFVFLISVLDGYSRAVLAWNLCSQMETLDVDLVIRRAHEKWVAGTELRPRIISDNGPQYLSRELRQTLKDFNMEHTRTSVAHPQSNGKLERFHGTIKHEKIRSTPSLSLDQMKSEIGRWIDAYNYERLHSSIGYVAPMDVIEGRRERIVRRREEKLKLARKQRAQANSDSVVQFNDAGAA